jgi:hypothetical protein
MVASLVQLGESDIKRLDRIKEQIKTKTRPETIRYLMKEHEDKEKSK